MLNGHDQLSNLIREDGPARQMDGREGSERDKNPWHIKAHSKCELKGDGEVSEGAKSRRSPS